MKIQRYILLLLFSTAVLVPGCDLYDKGLSFQQSSGSNRSEKNITPPATPETISGAVVTAPVHNTSVDIMLNGELKNIGYTENGIIHFTNLSIINKFPVILYANQQRKGHFADGTQVNIKPRGIMMSEKDSPYITPLTTLAALMFEQGPQTQEAAEQIKRKITLLVHNTYGLPNFNPFADPAQEGLSKHEVLQQAFLVTLGLGSETDAIAMDTFIPTVTDIVHEMESDTFLGAVKSVNPNLTSTIQDYINAHQTEITSRASSLLAKSETDPEQQKISRINFLKEMNDIVSSEFNYTAVPVRFLTTKVKEDGSFSPLPPTIPLPRNSSPIPFHFKITLLGSEDSIAETTANNTKEPTPVYSGEYVVTAINALGVLNEGTPLSPNQDTQLSAPSQPFVNGSEFTFFLDSGANVGSSHQITFTSVSDPTITATITFIAEEEDAVVIKSIDGTSSKKLFVFNGGDLTTIAKNSSCSLVESQLAATVTTDINVISSEELIKSVGVKFKLPEGLAFKVNDALVEEKLITTPPETTADSFIFTLPSWIQIVTLKEVSAEKKKVTMQVINLETTEVIAEDTLEGCFVSKLALNRIVGMELVDSPSLVQTYPADHEDPIVTIPNFTFSCRLLSWYDLAEIPKEEQPEYPLGYTPQALILRFENEESSSNGFVKDNGECVRGKDINYFITIRGNTMLTFEFMNYMPDWKDCRLKIKPYTSSDVVRLVYTEQGAPNTECYASGHITFKTQ